MQFSYISCYGSLAIFIVAVKCGKKTPISFIYHPFKPEMMEIYLKKEYLKGMKISEQKKEREKRKERTG